MLQSAVRKGVWLDVLLMAAHRPARVSLRGRAVDLQPGQCAVVMADWAKTLGLTPRQLERIVDSFVSESAVSKCHGPGKAYTLLTIEKYSAYQSSCEVGGERAVEATGKGRGKGGEREQEPEEPEEPKQEELPAVAGAATSRYRWEGRIIRLNDRDFTRWAASFKHLCLEAELESLDAWLVSPEATEKHRKGWLHVVAGALKNRNDAAKAKHDAGRLRLVTPTGSNRAASSSSYDDMMDEDARYYFAQKAKAQAAAAGRH